MGIDKVHWQPSLSKNGASDPKFTKSRSQEFQSLLQPLIGQLTQFLAKADAELENHRKGAEISSSSSILLNDISLSAEDLSKAVLKSLTLPDEGIDGDGLQDTVRTILEHSVNTTAPGFLDKLFGSPLPPGIAADLVLAVLNTNLHVYQVSPMLTLIEKSTTKQLAHMFGMKGHRAGGISVQGGSASNLTSIDLARNSLFPMTKVHGNSVQNNGKLIIFTSVHGHYSIEKAAQAVGLGSRNVVSVPVDGRGRMIASELDRLIGRSKKQGCTPFYINATAGTTVLGSFDPFDEIAVVAKKHHCWFHIDGAWGGNFVFAGRDNIRAKLRGAEKADSIAINPHKMLGVPVTCSFLLVRDLKLLQAAMTLRAGYLFHDGCEDEEEGAEGEDDQLHEEQDNPMSSTENHSNQEFLFDARDQEDPSWREPNDLADLTLQCGRRGDSLKFFLSWQYYGTQGYRDKVEHAYDLALDLSKTVDSMDDFTLVLGRGSQPECLQVCYYYTPQRKFVFGTTDSSGLLEVPASGPVSNGLSQNEAQKKICRYNTLVTTKISKALISRGFMIDFAPALEGQEDKGSFFRVVVNISTIPETMHRLIAETLDVGDSVLRELRQKYRPVM